MLTRKYKVIKKQKLQDKSNNKNLNMTLYAFV